MHASFQRVLADNCTEQPEARCIPLHNCKAEKEEKKEWNQVRWIFYADEFVLVSSVVSTTKITGIMLML